MRLHADYAVVVWTLKMSSKMSLNMSLKMSSMVSSRRRNILRLYTGQRCGR
ncbi:MAG: hypothetical protein LBF59_03935 [Prevotellaceae bacterium]|nr:hypothetical protein [Prevotellaceae bacterium]